MFIVYVMKHTKLLPYYINPLALFLVYSSMINSQSNPS